MIRFIYAQDEKGGIGLNNELPWHLPKELQHFKRETMGHPIIMGRRTFEAMGRRLLSGRQSVVVTRQEDYGKDLPELIVLHSIDDVLNFAEGQTVYLIGGAKLFNALWDEADEIVRTLIHADYDCDTFVPPLDESVWQLVKEKPGDSDEAVSYTYQWFKRIK